jgi:hypothetical protein
MKTSWLRYALVLGLSMGALAVPTGALAAGTIDPSIYMGSSQLGQASFDIPDPNNPCLDTSGFLFGANSVNSTPGSPSTVDTVVGVFVTTSDNCAGTTVSGLYYKGQLTSGTFQIDKTLTSASLHTTLTASDWNGNSVPVTVDVTWSGSGALTSGGWSSHFHRPGITIVTRSSGDSRGATATGAITVAGTSLTVSGPGSLQSDSSFNLFVCHPLSSGCK